MTTEKDKAPEAPDDLGYTLRDLEAAEKAVAAAGKHVITQVEADVLVLAFDIASACMATRETARGVVAGDSATEAAAEIADVRMFLKISLPAFDIATTIAWGKDFDEAATALTHRLGGDEVIARVIERGFRLRDWALTAAQLAEGGA